MKKKKLLSMMLTLFIISGCGSTSTSSSSTTSNSLSSSIFNGYVDLGDAYDNTQYYGLKYNEDYLYYLEIYNKEMFYSVFDNKGYIVLDNDPDFIHSFSTQRISDESVDFEMNVYGRFASANSLTRFEEENFIGLFRDYISKFTKVSENVWQYKSANLCKTLSTFFRTNSLKYCNLVEFTVGKDNRLETFKMYESDGITSSLIFSCLIDNIEKEELEMYNNWKSKGAIVEERIIDYKMLYDVDKSSISVYNDEIIDLIATVVAIDSDGNVYVANKDLENGNIGIKVVPSTNPNVKIGDIVEVKGKIFTDNYVVSIVDAKIIDTNEDAKYPPIFDEELIVDYYGGGTYAANVFSIVPYYSGSIYSTYAYVSEIPASLNKNSDTTIEVICPTYVNGEYTYRMEIIIPESLNLEKREILFSEFQNAGLYGEEGCYELNLSRYVMEFDINYFYGIKLLATADTDTHKKLNAQEKVAKYVGLESFPIINNSDGKVVSYRFGGASGQFLETTYNINSFETEGVYIGYTSVTHDEFLAFKDAIEMYGVDLIDIIKDRYNGKHYIYTYNGTVIDIQNAENQQSETEVVNIWIYNGEILKTPSIKQRLDNSIGSWFNKDNFLILENTYDYDYTLFSLLDYANNSYTQENPLYCVTLDTQENIRDQYCLGLVKQLGYSQYKVDNKAYTYTSRGQIHYVFQKDGVFLDIASYPTTDYTYAGHQNYQYRLEILIYNSEKPLEITTYNNLDILCEKYTSIKEEFKYIIDLPDNVVIEIWNNLNDFKLSPVEYGYGCRDEAFIYTDDVDGVYAKIQEGLLNSGYTKSYEKENSSSYIKTIGNETAYIFILKENDKGYVRFMHSVGGADFIR